jgi:nicotinamide-nucleotide amidase
MVSRAWHDLSPLEPAVRELAAALHARGLRIATAESCTGGLIAAACTALPGSSDWFERGFVTYSDDAKSELLDVDRNLITGSGAVSAAVACAMAFGAIAHSHADVAVSVTGIAGPSGAVPGKPVGTVWIALARRGESTAQPTLLQLQGDRAAVRGESAAHALRLLLATVRDWT